ncbi:MAG: Crp/Fnr family transcriptional regulator [bacterium]|nr:Crp/Fnr family transcriptional regulator [bacterium]
MSGNFAEHLMERAEKRRVMEKGAFLFHEGDEVQSVFIVEEGVVELTRPQLDGTAITLQRATDLTILAEASVYSRVYHCDAVASMPALVSQLSRSAFLANLKKDQHFSELWSVHLAKEVQSARYRSEILTKKTVRERLDAWLAFVDHDMPAKGCWKNVAEQLGVSPEAFYREMARRNA